MKKLSKEQEQKLLELFESFWSVNKKKVGKGAARDAWNKKFKKVDPENWGQLFDKIMLELSEQERHRKRIMDQYPDEYTRRQAGVFLPSRANPSTWINQERWHDELPREVEPEEQKIASRCHAPECQSKANHHTEDGDFCDWHWTKKYDRKHLKLLYDTLKKMGLDRKEGESMGQWSMRCREYLKTTAMGKALGA